MDIQKAIILDVPNNLVLFFVFALENVMTGTKITKSTIAVIPNPTANNNQLIKPKMMQGSRGQDLSDENNKIINFLIK